MKNNEEFRASVFAKAAAYKAERKRKRRAFARRALLLLVCALIAVPMLYIPIRFSVGSIATAPTAAPTLGAGSAFGTLGTLGTSETCEVFETTGAYTTTAAQTTTVHKTTTALKTTSVLQTTVHGTTGEVIEGPSIGHDYIDFVCDIFLGKAQNTFPHKVILKSREEALAYNSGEGMEQFLNDDIGENFFEKYAVAGYYIEIPVEKEVYIKPEFDASGNLICTVSCEAGTNSGDKKAVLASVCVSKAWLEKGKNIIFIYQEI